METTATDYTPKSDWPPFPDEDLTASLRQLHMHLRDPYFKETCTELVGTVALLDSDATFTGDRWQTFCETLENWVEVYRDSTPGVHDEDIVPETPAELDEASDGYRFDPDIVAQDPQLLGTQREDDTGNLTPPAPFDEIIRNFRHERSKRAVSGVIDILSSGKNPELLDRIRDLCLEEDEAARRLEESLQTEEPNVVTHDQYRKVQGDTEEQSSESPPPLSPVATAGYAALRTDFHTPPPEESSNPASPGDSTSLAPTNWRQDRPSTPPGVEPPPHKYRRISTASPPLMENLRVNSIAYPFEGMERYSRPAQLPEHILNRPWVESLKVTELKEELRARHWPVSGLKSDLQGRLLRALELE